MKIEEFKEIFEIQKEQTVADYKKWFHIDLTDNVKLISKLDKNGFYVEVYGRILSIIGSYTIHELNRMSAIALIATFFDCAHLIVRLGLKEEEK